MLIHQRKIGAALVLHKALSQALLFLLLLLLNSGCALSPDVVEVQHSSLAKTNLQALKNWEFTGRIALQNQLDSWSANIAWRHQPGIDQMTLSGPLGQGAVRIVLTADFILIDHGDGKIQHSANVDEFIMRQLGFQVPFEALRYWVLGIASPHSSAEDLADGFSQFGWQVHYQKFIPVQEELLPRKVRVVKDGALLKLIIDQWDLYG